MPDNLKVASVQFEHQSGDKSANLEKMCAFVEQAHQQGVELITFPECSITGYWYLRKLDRNQLMKIAEPVSDGPSSQAVLQWSQEYNMTIGAGLVEICEDGRMYNTYLVAMPDGSHKKHRKLHAFINEDIDCGDEFTVFDTPHGWRIGVLICYDNNLIENARMNALLGAEILLAPHQTGGTKSRSPHAMDVIDPEIWLNRKENPKAIEEEIRGPKGREWLMRWLPSRAHDNGLFILFSNGVGMDDDEVRTGNAMVLDPYGRILVETWKADDNMVIAELDKSLQPMSTGQRWLQARRPELYKLIATQIGFERSTRIIRFGEDEA
ncbi:MAG: nitrilase family protein [Candidatus Hinthialibacter antarcticus]|nr:nitrilase family protein [Candidatus Hinthialibacter antarcticus]